MALVLATPIAETLTMPAALRLSLGALALVVGSVGLAWTRLQRRERSNAERLGALFEHNPEAVAIYDLGDVVTSGNAAALRLVGHPAGALVGSRIAAYVAPDALATTLDAFARTVAGDETEVETVFVHSDGGRRAVLANLIPRRVDGTIVGVYAIGRDITPLARAREALEESGQRFRSLFEQHPDSVAMVDRAGAYVCVNAATERLTGIPAATFVGKPLGSLGLMRADSLRLPVNAMS